MEGATSSLFRSALFLTMFRSGCALLKNINVDLGSSSNKTYGNNEMNAARANGDVELFADMCMQKVEASVSVNDACKYATALYIDQGEPLGRSAYGTHDGFQAGAGSSAKTGVEAVGGERDYLGQCL